MESAKVVRDRSGATNNLETWTASKKSTAGAR